MAEGTVQSIEIPATPERIFEVVAAVSAYPEWADGVKAVEVLEEDGDGRAHRAHFTFDGMVKEISCVLVYSYDVPHRMSWSAEPGPDLELMEGSYEFTPIEDGTEVLYALRAEPAFKIPGFLRKQVEKHIVGTALRGLRKRVEAVG
jgi:ribosome-associated toxin RatA of RatAB toxin-antitoxin module